MTFTLRSTLRSSEDRVSKKKCLYRNQLLLSNVRCYAFQLIGYGFYAKNQDNIINIENDLHCEISERINDIFF